MKSHFVTDEAVEFEIEESKFKYKPVTGGQELEWMNEYIEYKNGQAVQNNQKKTECKLRNIVDVPYPKDEIKKQIGTEKEWKDLNKEQRLKLLKKLKPQILNKIIVKINKIDAGDDSKKK